MTLLNLKTEELFQIVFRDRNQAYGAYRIRKRYGRTLLLSTLIGVSIGITMVLIPFLLYLTEGTGGLTDDDFYYIVDYMPMDPPDMSELNELARAATTPPEAEEQAPVVKDSVQQEQPPPAEPEPQEEPQESDSLGPGGGVKDGEGTGDVTGIATVIDVHPRFPGGEEARLLFLKRSVRYPQGALQAGIQGVVVVVFIIETDGSISHVQIEKGIGGGCDEESVRVVKTMPRWEPGKRQGKAVRVMIRMPVVFRIPGPGK